MKHYWLMKSEPNVYSFDDLLAEPEGQTCWEGVRNYQARNMMRDEMKLGDQVFFYHSNCAEPGIVGIAEVAREGYADDSAFDPKSRYFDPKSDPEAPRWQMVDVRPLRKLSRTITLAELKGRSDLDGLALIRRGNRLSVMPVSPAHFEAILALE